LKKRTRIKQIIAVALFFVLTAPCILWADDKAQSSAKIVRLAVLPFQVVEPNDHASTTAQCPVCRSINPAGAVAPGAENVLQELFTAKLKGLKNTEFIPEEKAAAVYHRIVADSLKRPLLKTMMETGSELKADYVVEGFVYLYKERIGYDYSVEHPASVAFEIHIVSVKDGATVWRGIYDKTQKSLMEDIFQLFSFFRGGAKWLTARELTKLGIDEVFETFPGFE
jgi:hypothetical protein